MFKEYTISDLLSIPPEHIAYYAGIIELRELDLEWPHRHSFYTIIWYLEGNGYNIIDFNEYRISDQRLFLINPQQIINCEHNFGCKGYIIMISKSLAAQLSINFHQPFIDIEESFTPILKFVFDNLIKEFEIDNEESQSRIKIAIQYFYSLISDKMQDDFGNLDQMNKTFMEFKELMQENDLAIQSIDDYADALCVSTAELNTISQDLTGASAKQFMLEFKITEAKRLLLYSELNINEISFKLGFEDASYFSRIFKKKTKLSPTTFLEKYRK